MLFSNQSKEKNVWERDKLLLYHKNNYSISFSSIEMNDINSLDKFKWLLRWSFVTIRQIKSEKKKSMVYHNVVNGQERVCHCQSLISLLSNVRRTLISHY
jgi:hypothetical protein